MAIGTRSSSKSPVKKAAKDNVASDATPQAEPLKHFILPRQTSSQARFILLQHPQDSSIQRFLFCPEKGFYQFTKVGSPSIDPRSLLFSQARSEDPDSTDGRRGDDSATPPVSNGYISKRPDFFVATPFDLAFILIPFIVPAKVASGKILFQPVDDLLEEHTREDQSLRWLVHNGRERIEVALTRFCDAIEAGDEQMFRYNEEKLLHMFLAKAKGAICSGLPSSILENFVTRALEAPMLSVKREEKVVSIVPTRAPAPDEEGDEEDAFESLDSQSSAASAAPSTVFSEASVSTTVSSIVDESIPEKLVELQKQRTVLDFMMSSYLPETLAARLQGKLDSKTSPIDFQPLRTHLKSLAQMRADALASRSITDFSRKRSLDDDEASEMRAEKKRKQDEEDKKKKLGESRGVRDLKKVNVSGMKKMSDFFKKPATKIK